MANDAIHGDRSGLVPAAGLQNGDHADANGTPPAYSNPHPGRVFLSRQYVADEWISRQLLLVFSDSGKEARDRFEGVDQIDSLVNFLQL